MIRFIAPILVVAGDSGSARRLASSLWPSEERGKTLQQILRTEAIVRAAHGILPAPGPGAELDGNELLGAASQAAGEPFLIFSQNAQVEAAVEDTLRFRPLPDRSALTGLLRYIGSAPGAVRDGDGMATLGRLNMRIGDLHTARRALDNALAYAERQAAEDARRASAGEMARRLPIRDLVPGLLRLGEFQKALDAALADPERQAPADMALVAEALASAGKAAEARSVLEQAYSAADAIRPGRIIFGFGPKVDTGRFEAYRELVRVEMILGDHEDARLHALIMKGFRLATSEAEVDLAETLASVGAMGDALDLLRAQASSLQAADIDAKRKMPMLVRVGASLYRMGDRDGALAILLPLDDGSRSEAGRRIIDGIGLCGRARDEVASLAGALHLRYRGGLLVAAAAECLRLGAADDAGRLAEAALAPEAADTDPADVALIAYAIGRKDLTTMAIQRCAARSANIFDAGFRASALSQDAAMAAEFLASPSGPRPVAPSQ